MMTSEIGECEWKVTRTQFRDLVDKCYEDKRNWSQILRLARNAAPSKKLWNQRIDSDETKAFFVVAFVAANDEKVLNEFAGTDDEFKQHFDSSNDSQISDVEAKCSFLVLVSYFRDDKQRVLNFYGESTVPPIIERRKAKSLTAFLKRLANKKSRNSEPDDIKIRAYREINRKTKKGESFRSLTKLAEAVGCSKSGKAIKEVWDEIKPTGPKTDKAQHLHSDVESNDELSRLIEDQKQDSRRDGLSQRLKV